MSNHNTFQLCTYQERHRDAIVNDCVEHIQFGNKQERVAGLAVPTGGGKTAIASKAIKDISARLNGQVAFVWLTISSGDLDEQTHTALEKYLNRSSVNVYSVQEALSACPNNMAGSVVVIGWSTINHDKDGQPDNIVMRSGDKTNFPEMCENTRNAGIPIVLIIDESHSHADTKRSKQRKDQYIQPLYTLEVSATPKNFDLDFVRRSSYKEVSDAHMIKKEIYKQTFLDYKYGVRGAAIHLKYLIDLAKKINAQFSPKMLIFVPNENSGAVELEELLALLQTEFDWTENNGAVKIVLANHKTINWENCKQDNNDPTRVIITKEAIGTGVDIPSISMIVQLRPTKSVRVEVQKLGRGLRMPEQKHYGNDLDTLFFCVFNDHILDFDGAEFLKDAMKQECTIKPELNGLIASLPALHSMYYERIESFKEVCEEDFDATFSPIFLEALKSSTIESFSLDERHIETTMAGSIDMDAKKENVDITAEHDDISTYENDIRKRLKHLYKFRTVIENTISKYLCLDVESELYVVKLRTFILNRLSDIEAIVFDSVKKSEEKLKIERIKKNYIYTIPNKYEFIGEKEERHFNNFAYDKYLLDSEGKRSEVEERFEKYLDTKGVWIKNYDRKYGKSFSVPYRGVDGRDKNFFPDYILILANGTTLILETKAGNLDAETNTKRDALITFLDKYKNIIGGIVRMDHDHFYIDRGVGREPLDDIIRACKQ